MVTFEKWHFMKLKGLRANKMAQQVKMITVKLEDSVQSPKPTWQKERKDC